MYNIDFKYGSSQPTRVNMYVNLSSYVNPTDIAGDGTDGKYIIIKFRGRNNNYQRSIIAIPTTGVASNPQYTYNDRYWLIAYDVYFPLASEIPGGLNNQDIVAKKLIGRVVLPADETYDITYFYDDTWSPITHNASGVLQVTEMPEIKSVLNVTQSASVSGSMDSTQPTTYYNAYADNDLVETNMNSYGKPYSDSVDNRDVEYGVQTWTPTYDN